MPAEHHAGSIPSDGVVERALVDVDELIRAGLYDPLAPEGEERLELLRWLVARGATVGQLLEADEDARLIAVAGDLIVFPEGRPITARQAAERSGVGLATVDAMWRALGLQLGDVDTPRLTEADIDVLSEFRAATELLNEAAVLEFVRVLGSSLTRVAEAASAIFGAEVFIPGWDTASLLERAQLDEMGRASLMRVPSSIEPIFRHIHDAVMRRANKAFDPVTKDTLPLAVGFVDLVGFTPLSRRLSTEELVELVTKFEARATDLAASYDARVVKLIGDEVMFVALDPIRACEVALGLTESFRSGERPVTPRGGVAFGQVLARSGDYFGPTVNLAARIAELAVPDEILTDSSVCDFVGATETRFRFDSAGRRMLKGFEEPVGLHSVARC
jgi:adenylate cyclase